MIYTNENWKPPVTYCEPNKAEVQIMNKEEAIEILRDIYQFLRTQYTHRYTQKEAIDMAIEALQAEPLKHGKWNNIPIGDMKQCSNCGYICTPILAYQDIYNYCPNCGAKMDGGVK